MTKSPSILEKIDAFLRSPGCGYSETGFGIAVLNDGKLIASMRAGRRLWPETATKVLAFIEQCQATVDVEGTCSHPEQRQRNPLAQVRSA